MILDDRMRAAIARLTENEKECLRRRLLPQTAKEMAIELGVSPHAVEKRLKMARTKLGLPSSLQAARLLVASEASSAYKMPVPQPSDLAQPADPANGPSHTGNSRRWWIMGAGSMGIAILAAGALWLSMGPNEGQARERASAEDVATFLGRSFDSMDKDRSGYIEEAEVPHVSVRVNSPVARKLDPKEAWKVFLSRNDRDGDGKVSRAEFIAAMSPALQAAGLPSGWKWQYHRRH